MDISQKEISCFITYSHSQEIHMNELIQKRKRIVVPASNLYVAGFIDALNLGMKFASQDTIFNCMMNFTDSDENNRDFFEEKAGYNFESAIETTNDYVLDWMERSDELAASFSELSEKEKDNLKKYLDETVELYRDSLTMAVLDMSEEVYVHADH